jgi:hypothetical protein
MLERHLLLFGSLIQLHASFDPERLWVITRATGTHNGPLVNGDNVVVDATGKKYNAGPEAWSFSFDQDGLCYR